ncbi:MAG: hypothetical protein V4692_08660 [Bdellovibrionota bacterium]
MSITAAFVLSSFVCATHDRSVVDPVSYRAADGKIVRTQISQHGTLKRSLKIDKKVVSERFTAQLNGEVISVIDQSGKEILSIEPDFDGEFGNATDGSNRFRCVLNREAKATRAKSEKPYCEKRQDPEHLVQSYHDPKNRLAFANGPWGLMDGGLCWWFSRFERNAIMLAVYKPELPKPSSSEAKKIINRLRSTSKVVEIPGFENLFDFTTAFKSEFIASMESWQLNDGIFSFAWVRGLYGRHEERPEVLRKAMDRTFGLVEENKRPTFQLLQMAGIVAHSWIVVAMDKKENGYDLLVADSNFNEALMWHEYRYDMRQLPFYKAVPYLQTAFNKEADEAVEAGAKYCASPETNF